MPDGYINLVGDDRADVARRQAVRRRRIIEHLQGPTDWTYWKADVAPRPTARMEAFDYGDEPLPGCSSSSGANPPA
jgi:hypothetical protein